MPNRTIEQLIADFKQFYAEHAPEMLNSYQSQPATEEEVDDLEMAVEQSLPDEFRRFLLTSDIELHIDGNFNTMSAKKIVRRWNKLKEQLEIGTFEGREKLVEDAGNFFDGRIEKVWWSLAWIPFAQDSCGNLKCLDMQPGTNGVIGQIMIMEFQDAQGPFSTSFDSFRDYVAAHWECLQKGWYEIDDEGLLSIDIPTEDKRSW